METEQEIGWYEKMVFENKDIKPGGCEFCKACLTCPLDTCVEDLPRRALLYNAVRRDFVKSLAKSGVARTFIAQLFRISIRTVEDDLVVKTRTVIP
jgi:hypothetical protein